MKKAHAERTLLGHTEFGFVPLKYNYRTIEEPTAPFIFFSKYSMQHFLLWLFPTPFLSLGERRLKGLVCGAFHSAPDPSLQGH